MTDKIFFAGSFGFISGVFFRSFFDLGFSFIVLLVFISFILFFFRKTEFQILLAAVFILLSAFGITRFELSDYKNEILDKEIGNEILIEGYVAEEPDIRETHTKLIVALGEQETRALILTEHFPEFQYGDRVEIVGELERPKNFSPTEGEKFFDYVSFLAKDDIYHQFFFPEIKKLEGKSGSFIRRGLFAFKREFLRNVGEVVPEPHAALLGGLVVGAKQSLGKELLEDFRKTGLIHIVVLSGYNVMIVADSIIKFFSFLPKTFGLAMGGFSIILFAIMTGGGPATVRASIMAVLGIVARLTGRTYAVARALVFALVLMILWNPKVLVFDVGFQLSFIATLGIIYLAPIVEQKIVFLPERFALRETITTTLAAQISVAPWILYKIGDFSIVALPVNILVLPFVPVTMLFGFLTGLVGFVSNALSLPFGWVTYFLLSYELKIVDIFANLPFASFEINSFPLVLTTVAYVLLVRVVWYRVRLDNPVRGGPEDGSG